MSDKTSEFIKKAKNLHHEKFDYSLVEYTSSRDKVIIICRRHDLKFQQIASNHLRTDGGCKMCMKEKLSKKLTKNLDEFVKDAIQIHGNRYDYSEVKYVNNLTPIKIYDKVNNVYFYQTPKSHLAGCHSVEDGRNRTTQQRKLTTNKFIEKAEVKHNNFYDYSNVDYITTKTKVKIVCPIHGEFLQTPNDHLNGCGCPTCGNQSSKQHDFIKAYLIKNDIYYSENDRKILNGKELDFYLPDYNIAIECNGLYWHSESQGKDGNYHLNKTKTCEQHDIKLIQIFENEILQNPKVVISELNNILKINKRKIDINKCQVKRISKKIKTKFINKYHLFGDIESMINLGLYYKNKLISVIVIKDNTILRYCNNFNFCVDRGLNRLLNHYTKEYTPAKLSIRLDRRWMNDEEFLYEQFERIEEIPPKCWCFNRNNKKNKLYHLNEINVDTDLIEKIWDCGYVVMSKNCV